VYLPYGVFPNWSYLRFLMPALVPAYVLVGALLVAAVTTIPPPARGLILAASLTLAGSFNAVVATREQAFNLRHYESRYRSVGRFLAATLPAETVLVAAQESGSAHYYTGRPVLRWDLLTGDLDATLAALEAQGRRPILVIEDWERPALRARFPRSRVAVLDWPPLADIGETTRVWVLDPADRERATPTPLRFR
jgi:hypothetical protein